MTVTRKGGVSGKVCEVCQEWKMLCEFASANKTGMFKGFRNSMCQSCERTHKQQNKRKNS